MDNQVDVEFAHRFLNLVYLSNKSLLYAVRTVLLKHTVILISSVISVLWPVRAYVFVVRRSCRNGLTSGIHVGM